MTFNVHTGDRSWPYFVEGEGIEHHVIRTDICRYLSGDALVRKGNWEGRDGFFYYGFRLLTEAQIRTLRTDSDRWLKERAENWNRRREAGPEYARSQTLHQSIQLQQQQHNTPPDPVGGERTTYSGGYQYPPVPPPAPPPAPEPVAAPDPPYDPQRYVYDQDGRPYYDLIRRQYIPNYRPTATQDENYQPTRIAGETDSQRVPRHVPAPPEPAAVVQTEAPSSTNPAGYWDYRDGRPVWIEYRASRGTH